MTDMIYFLFFIFLFFGLYVLTQQGRIGHKGLDALQGWNYAHRGLHGDNAPENSMTAFKKALEHGYGIELDIHLMKDGNLAVIHDSSLKRTVGVDIHIEDLTVADLHNYPLEGTDETVPTFQQVLELYAGKAPIIIELKSERGNHAELCLAACNAVKDYQGVICMESFDPRCILWLKKNRPDIIRGQLSENFLRNSKSKLPLFLKWIMTWNIPNFLTRPDFVAYKFADRANLSLWLCRKLWKVQGVTWTLRSQKEHDAAIKEGWIPIFENYLP